MRRIVSSLACGLVLLSAVGGCKKPPATDPDAVNAAQALPGATEVMAAIQKKDFEGVLTALGKVRDKVTTEDQNVQFLLLARQARDKIQEVAPNDPKAMEVVATLRALSTGGR